MRFVYLSVYSSKVWGNVKAFKIIKAALNNRPKQANNVQHLTASYLSQL